MHAFRNASATVALLALTGCASLDPEAMQAVAAAAGQVMQHRLEASQQRQELRAQQEAQQQALEQQQAAAQQQAYAQQLARQGWRQQAREQRAQQHQQRAQARIHPYRPLQPGYQPPQPRNPYAGWGTPYSR